MKIVFVYLFVLCIPIRVLATERSNMEQKVSELLGFEDSVEHCFDEYKRQLIKLYPQLTNEYIDFNYGAAFEYGKKRYMESYMKSLSVYSDKEIKTIIDDHYLMNNWLMNEKRLESNKILINELSLAYEDVNAMFIEKIDPLEKHNGSNSE
ncbi:hypothetical protein [Vibrio sp. Vb339]|uniref:hypothetical protein n=1 Tax=Vibrio sp. Vb339 TaxID=1192013 RepID=UPI00155693E7|nr:hypothetical protein [Vibrio sp. Vb339]